MTEPAEAARDVTIVPITTAAQWRDFHALPPRIYADDPHWVRPLRLDRRMQFSARHNPFFAHARTAFWIAYRGREPVGTISAQIDRLHLERYADATGHFGALEAIDDPAVVAALLRQAELWLAREDMTRALGPVTLSMWEQPGLLVEGFDTPPSVMMGHARPYMGGHIERAGYAKAQDLIAYDYDVTRPMPSTGLRAVQRANARPDVAFRPMRMDRRHIKAEIETIVDIMHDAWSDNFGFVPMTQAEVAKIAGELRLVLRPVDTCIAEVGGRPMAFAMIFPNLNDAIRDLDGRLFPFGWAKLLWRLKVRRPTTGRMPLMGLRKELQATALGGALALGVIEKTRALHAAEGARRGELSWILEQNLPVRHIIEMIGGIAYKRYRIYGKSLPG